ncbi:toxin-antitoxin system HicB family antitoxin [Desulfovibrio sp. OttesenSCG-928-G11]|nr:toxin-antitoxin system HicB family antitoxin [Desulfovibrio sp. OttesenSCG-928-G11]
MKALEYKGYTALIRHSQEDGCYIGIVAGLDRHSITFEGESEEEAHKDFERAIDFYLETTPNQEKPFSGSICLRISPELQKYLSKFLRIFLQDRRLKNIVFSLLTPT